MSVTAKAHELLSRRLLLPLWHAQRLARPSRRPVAAAIREGLRFRRAAALLRRRCKTVESGSAIMRK